MPITRSKRMAGPMISLSAVKKRRIAKDVEKYLVNEEAEETQERTTCTEIPQVAKFVENSLNVEEIEVAPDNDIINTSDLNQNISAEIESIDDDNDLHFEETEVEEEIIVPEKTSRKTRDVNIGIILVEEFETKSVFDDFWTKHEFSKIYNYCMERACRIEYEVDLKI